MVHSPPRRDGTVRARLDLVALDESMRVLRRSAREPVESEPLAGEGGPQPLAERLADPGTTELQLEARENLRVVAAVRPLQREPGAAGGGATATARSRRFATSPTGT
jgi:hypothetical protein